MKVKINEKLICIPPYLSVTWDQVTCLQSEEDPLTKNFTLIVHLTDGKVIEAPNLDSSLIDIAFSAHMKHLEDQPEGLQVIEGQPGVKSGNLLQQLTGLNPEQLSGMPIRFGIAGIPGVEGIETAFQHNPAQADAPDMPLEVLEKVSGIANMLTNGDPGAFPKPEPHCNCMHCQLARAVHGISKEELSDETEDPISEEDLAFRTWDIKKSGDNLYTVTNPLDQKEKYSVYLGKPVGCTCGHEHCEHIKAVLYS